MHVAGTHNIWLHGLIGSGGLGSIGRNDTSPN